MAFQQNYRLSKGRFRVSTPCILKLSAPLMPVTRGVLSFVFTRPLKDKAFLSFTAGKGDDVFTVFLERYKRYSLNCYIKRGKEKLGNSTFFVSGRSRNTAVISFYGKKVTLNVNGRAKTIAILNTPAPGFTMGMRNTTVYSVKLYHKRRLFLHERFIKPDIQKFVPGRSILQKEMKIITEGQNPVGP